jgi:hypothetical protein
MPLNRFAAGAAGLSALKQWNNVYQNEFKPFHRGSAAHPIVACRAV